MVVGRANSEELNVVEESDEENTMLPPYYTDGKLDQVKPEDTDSVVSSNGQCADDKSEDCDTKDDENKVNKLFMSVCCFYWDEQHVLFTFFGLYRAIKD